jgi:hypothetical protein
VYNFRRSGSKMGNPGLPGTLDVNGTPVPTLDSGRLLAGSSEAELVPAGNPLTHREETVCSFYETSLRSSVSH